MSEAPTEPRADLTAIAGDIVAAYVSNNHVATADLPVLIARVHRALIEASGGIPATAAAHPGERPSPAQIKHSITHDGLVSFVDGKTYKTLKRHLTKHGLYPAAYRERYGLPDDYPMVCASYRAQRSSLAKASGLGVPGGRAVRANMKPKGQRKAA